MRGSTAFVALTFALAACSSNSETHGTSDASHVPKGAGAPPLEGS